MGTLCYSIALKSYDEKSMPYTVISLMSIVTTGFEISEVTLSESANVVGVCLTTLGTSDSDIIISIRLKPGNVDEEGKGVCYNNYASFYIL